MVRNIISDNTQGLFKPDKYVTQAEFSNSLERIPSYFADSFVHSGIMKFQLITRQ